MVKLIEDYTKEQLIDLDEKQLEHLFASECAYQNIPLPSSLIDLPPKPQDQESFTPDMSAYKINGGSYGDIYVSTIEQAEEVVRVIDKNRINVGHEYSRSYTETRYFIRNEKINSVTFEAVKVYSADKWIEYQTAIKEYDANNAEYKETEKYNRELREKHNKVWDDINKAVRNARIEFNNADKMAAELKNYIAIADGNTHTAKKFLINAHHDKLIDLSDEALATVGVTREEVNFDYSNTAEATPAEPINDSFPGE